MQRLIRWTKILFGNKVTKHERPKKFFFLKETPFDFGFNQCFKTENERICYNTSVKLKIAERSRL